MRNPAIDWGAFETGTSPRPDPRSLRIRRVYSDAATRKNLLLDRRKTLARKVEELFLAHWVTERISKTRILELYLNVIEFGPQIFGINQAAEFYFQKSPMSLSVDESLFLAMLKPSPKLGRQYVADGQTPQYPFWHERAVQLRRRLQENGFMRVSEEKLSAPLTLKWTNGKYQPNDDPGAN